MERAQNLKYNGELLLGGESSPQLLKDACFYVAKKYENVSDEEFKSWLVNRRDQGFMESDIKEFEEDVYKGEFGYLMKGIKELPPYISIVIGKLLEINNLLKKGKRR